MLRAASTTDDSLSRLQTENESLWARVQEAEQALRDVRRWFDTKPWQGSPDAGSFGGHDYSENERAIGYGTYRDPRFLPAALRAVFGGDVQEQETDVSQID